MILNEFFDSNKKHSAKQGVAEGSGQLLSVQQLAAISDAALDQAYGYGRSTPGNTFGWQANLMSAAYAKKLIDAGVTDIEKISDAIHKGWNVTAQKFVQNPEQFDDTEKLRQAGKLEAKLQQRAKLMKINYAQLDNEEQEKDRVVARALLQAIKSQQGVAEARSPEEFVRQMDKIAATPQTFEVGDWVTIDPNETSGYASSGMIGRIIELYDDEGESMAKIAVGSGSGVQKKLGKGVRSSGTHTVVPTSILQKDDPRGVAEGATDDPRFQKMMGNIQQSTPNPVSGYVAVSYASERPSKKIKGVTYNGKPMPSTVDPEGFASSKIKFTPDQIEAKLTGIGQKYGWDSIDPGHGQGYDELYFDTSTKYTSATQRKLATNIVKTVNEINKFFNDINRSLQATGLPGYKASVWQGMGENGNINQYEDLSHITNIAKGQTAKPDAGPAIGKMILKHLPSYEAENDELGYYPQDFQDARNIANIYITKGERAGLQAQHNYDAVSDMIDELLSDAGGSGLRTIGDLDEQGVAEGDLQEIQRTKGDEEGLSTKGQNWGKKTLSKIKMLPGSQRFGYTAGGAGRASSFLTNADTIIELFDVKHPQDGLRKAGFLALRSAPWFPIKNSYQVSNVGLDDEYRGTGLGQSLYGIAMKLLKMTIVADDSQTPQARSTWVRLSQIPGVSINGYTSIFRDDWAQGNNPDEIYDDSVLRLIRALSKANGQVLGQNSDFVWVSFPVGANADKGELQSVQKGIAIYSSQHPEEGGTTNGLYARWGGQVREQGVAEGLNEFDAKDFQQRYTLYKDGYEIEKFSDMDDAIEYAEDDRRDGDDPLAVYKIVDINKQVVWDSNPYEKPSRIQLRKPEQGVAEAFGPLPKDNQQIRLGRHTVDIERVGLDKNYIGFAWHDSQGQEHYEEVAVGDLGSYDDLIDRIKDEIRYVERQYTDQGVAEGSDFPQWRVEQSDATGRYYVVKGYTDKSRKVWKNKLGAIDFNKKADAEAKANELNQGVTEVSDATKQNYKARAQAQVRELKPYTKKGEYRDIAQRAIDRRQKGLDRVPDKTNITSVTESGMKEKSIEFRDYQTMTPGAFHSRYSMTRDEWMARNRNLFSKINPAHQARDTALAKMRQAAAARADVKAAQALAPRVSEAVTTPEGRPALGQANIETLIQTYKQNRPFAELSFGKSGNLNINRQQMRLIMDHYLKLGSPEEKHDFVYETMSRMLKVVAMFNSYGIDVRTQISMPPGQTSQIPGAQPQLFELDASEVKDTRLSRALKQARAEFPTAGSDIEAFLKLVMSNDDRDLATMNRIQTVNTKQSELIDRIQNIDNQQTKEIDDLESQLDRVTSVNQELKRQLDAIQAKPKRDDKKDSKPEQSKQPENKPLRRPATPELPVAQAAKASKPKTKKTQQAKPLELPAPAAKAAPLQIGYDPAQASLFGLDKEVSDVIPIYRGQDSANDSAQSPISMYDKEIGSLTQADLDQDAANDTAQPRRQANAESRKPQRAIADTDFDSPEWHEKVRGIGQRAKQGPLKTVWDEKRKVYRNVPVDRPPANNKPNMTEARLQRRAVLLKILES